MDYALRMWDRNLGKWVLVMKAKHCWYVVHPLIAAPGTSWKITHAWHGVVYNTDRDKHHMNFAGSDREGVSEVCREINERIRVRIETKHSNTLQ